MSRMGSPLLPLTIALGAAVADGTGAHHAAFYLVLLAVPAAAAAALAAAGDLAEGRQVALRTICTALALGLLVVSSATRANAPEGAGVPAVAVSALVAGLLAYAAIGLGWLVRPAATAPQVRRRVDESAGDASVERRRESRAA
jgi:hypothetical protein